MQSLDIWYVASPGGPLPRLFIWCPWGQNWPCLGVTSLKNRNKEEKFFCETRSRALIIWPWTMIFGIYSHCTPLLLGTQVSDIGPSWSSCFSITWHLFCDKALRGSMRQFWDSSSCISCLRDTVHICGQIFMNHQQLEPYWFWTKFDNQ